jgi:hypothetical protein
MQVGKARRDETKWWTWPRRYSLEAVMLIR